jgi:hypothetical protein
MTTTNYIAFDLGASSGRTVIGRFDGETLSLEDAHRFENGPTRLLDSIHWNALSLFTEIKSGLAKAAAQLDGNIAAVGVDTWGVDFALLDKSGDMIGNPYHYRDSRNEGMLEAAFELVPRKEIFQQTGIQLNANQYPVPTAGNGPPEPGCAGDCRYPAVYARSVQLLAYRPQNQRILHCQHQPGLQHAAGALGHRLN